MFGCILGQRIEVCKGYRYRTQVTGVKGLTPRVLGEKIKEIMHKCYSYPAHTVTSPPLPPETMRFLLISLIK